MAGLRGACPEWLKRGAEKAAEYIPTAGLTGGAVGAALGTGAMAAEGAILNAVGFTALGPAAGSWAAGTMSSIAVGNGVGVAAGSGFAAAQSAAMGGAALVGAPFVVGCTVACTAVGVAYGQYKRGGGADGASAAMIVDASAPDLDEFGRERTMGENQASKWKKTALIVVDMQNDFLNPESCLFVAGGPAVIPGVVEAVKIARNKGAFVVWVVREHHESGRDVEYIRKHLYNGTSGPTMRGSDGAALVEGLVAKPGEHKIMKYRFSAFFATNLDLVLRREGIAHVVVAGVQTPNCIRATAFDAVAHDYPSVTVLSDATGAQNDAIHSANLLDMRNVSIATPTVAEWAASSTDNVDVPPRAVATEMA